MKWTIKKPMEPGFYWYKSGEHDTTVVEISADGTIGVRKGGRTIRLTPAQFRSRYGKGRWYGPIHWEMG